MGWRIEAWNHGTVENTEEVLTAVMNNLNSPPLQIVLDAQYILQYDFMWT